MREGTPLVITPVDMSWRTIESAYKQGLSDPERSLSLGQEYAGRVAEELKERLAFMHVPYDLFQQEAFPGRVYGVEGIGFRLGPRLRRHVEMVYSPRDLPQYQDWVAMSGGHRAVITSSTPETTEYLEALLASRNSPRGRRQLVDFLYEEAMSLALSDGQKVFASHDGRFLHPDNMFSALARTIEPLVVNHSERQRRTRDHSHPIRRGNLVLV